MSLRTCCDSDEFGVRTCGPDSRSARAQSDACYPPTTQTRYVAILRAGNIQDGTLTFDDLVYVPRGACCAISSSVSTTFSSPRRAAALIVVGKAARAPADLDVGFGAFLRSCGLGAAIDPRYFALFRTPRYRRTISRLAAGAITNLRMNI